MRPNLLFLFDLRNDQQDPDVIDDMVPSGVQFGGTNLWVLFFAILIASVGLNTNSTAVIIGAMLISPLMGPIVGLGYGAAVQVQRWLGVRLEKTQEAMQLIERLDSRSLNSRDKKQRKQTTCSPKS